MPTFRVITSIVLRIARNVLPDLEEHDPPLERYCEPAPPTRHATHAFPELQLSDFSADRVVPNDNFVRRISRAAAATEEEHEIRRVHRHGGSKGAAGELYSVKSVQDTRSGRDGEDVPRTRMSLSGHARYMAKPAGVVAVNMLQSESKRASNIRIGFVEDIEWRARFMDCGGRAQALGEYYYSAAAAGSRQAAKRKTRSRRHGMPD